IITEVGDQRDIVERPGDAGSQQDRRRDQRAHHNAMNSFQRSKHPTPPSRQYSPLSSNPVHYICRKFNIQDSQGLRLRRGTVYTLAFPSVGAQRRNSAFLTIHHCAARVAALLTRTEGRVMPRGRSEGAITSARSPQSGAMTSPSITTRSGSRRSRTMRRSRLESKSVHSPSTGRSTVTLARAPGPEVSDRRVCQDFGRRCRQGAHYVGETHAETQQFVHTTEERVIQDAEVVV